MATAELTILNHRSNSMFKLSLVIPRQVLLFGESVSREDFFSWIWRELSNDGLLGVHEGTLLSEDAAEQGMETESWTVDSGEAPRERDWVGRQEMEEAELYFSTESQAQGACEKFRAIPGVQVGEVTEQPEEDWDAEWKASFLNSGEGVAIEVHGAPFWRIVPPWFNSEQAKQRERIIKINPGAGFGTGTHETTQLCLQAIGEWVASPSVSQPVAALDFGSGSGILSIGLALLGAQVDAVEIDPLAIDNSVENAILNSVQDRIQFNHELSGRKSYSIIVANILKPVLLEFSKELVQRLKPEGAVLILSGLIEQDVSPVVERYQGLLGKPPKRILSNHEWRALVF